MRNGLVIIQKKQLFSQNIERFEAKFRPNEGADVLSHPNSNNYSGFNSITGEIHKNQKKKIG